MNTTAGQLKTLLDAWSNRANRLEFIDSDPIRIPHAFTDPTDIEIAGFFTAILSWGQRKTILNKCTELMERMDNKPLEFIKYAGASDLKRLVGFKHRTFNDTDLLFLVDYLRRFFTQHDSLEFHFTGHPVREGLQALHWDIFSVTWAPARTQKHISTPLRNSACKRLNMYLRWMVRRDQQGVDFGLWNSIAPKDLMIPLDVHVQRVALHLGLLKRKASDWKAVEELTANLRILDPMDPVRYDFALFYMGLEGFQL